MKILFTCILLLAIFIGVYYASENNSATAPTIDSKNTVTVSESDISQRPDDKSQTVQIPTHHSDSKAMPKSTPGPVKPDGK